jgi:hypothetical protein
MIVNISKTLANSSTLYDAALYKRYCEKLVGFRQPGDVSPDL